MLKYYKILKLMFRLCEHDDLDGSSGFYHSRKTLSSLGSVEKKESSKSSSSEIKTQGEWIKSDDLIAGITHSNGISQKDHDVYTRSNGDKIDIKIERGALKWDVELKGIPKGLEQDAVNELMKMDLGALAGKELIWNLSKNKLQGLNEDYQNEHPISIEEINEEISFFSNLSKKGDITNSDLSSINYPKIESVLRRAFLGKQEKNVDFLKGREDLYKVISDVIYLYNQRIKLQGATDFKRDEKFEKFVNFKNNLIVTNGLIDIQRYESMGLDELIDNYKRTKNNDGTRLIITQIIIDKHIKQKGNSIAYSDNGEINIYDKDNKIISDEKLSIISQDDFKKVVLRDVITSSGFDVTKEKPDYTTMIPKILNKYEIKDENGSDFVFSDIYRRKGDLIGKINKKLKDNIDINTIRDLKFVLDYIKNEKSYSVELIQTSAQLSVARKYGYDPTTPEGYEKIGKAFKEKHGVSTIINDVMSANGGLVGAAAIIFCIVGLFVGKWRNAALGVMGVLVFGPAIEELAYKWGLWDEKTFDGALDKNGNKSEKGTTVKMPEMLAGLVSSDIDISIKSLPDEYSSMYEKMYKENIKKSDKSKILFPQDLAQIYGQLSKNKDVRDIRITPEIEAKIKNGDDILGNNCPKKYVDGLIQSKKGDKILESREIKNDDVNVFLAQLLANKEDGDKTIGDLLQKGQKETVDYVDNTKFKVQNKAINDALDNIPFNNPNKKELEKIVGRTKEIFSVVNAKATAEQLIGINNSRKKQIDGIIKELNEFKAKAPDLSVNIGVIIGEFNKVLESMGLDIKIEDYNTKAFRDGELMTGMSFVKDTANKGIDFWSRAIGYFKLDPGFSVDTLNKVKIEDIDKLVEEGNKLIETNGITTEQMKTINDLILKLREKKLTVLRAKDEKVRQHKKGVMSGETQKAFVELVEFNSKEYEDKINSINLQSKPALESMQSYNSLFVQNAENLLFLQGLAGIDNRLITQPSKLEELVNIATKKVTDYNGVNGFLKNLENYVKGKKEELTNISEGLNEITLDNILKTQEQLQKIKSEFINDGTIFKVLNELGTRFGIDSIQSNGNVIADFEAYYSQVLKTPISLSSAEFKTSLDNVELEVNTKIIELINNEKLPEFGNPVLGQVQIKKFISDVKLFKEKIGKFNEIKDSFVDTAVKNKLTELNTLIKRFENTFISGLGNNQNDNSRLFEDWKMVKKELGIDSNLFETAYGEKSIELLSIPNYINTEIDDIHIGKFVINVKNYKTEIKKFESTNKELVKAKLDEIETKIKQLELLFISQLKPGDKDDIKNMDEQTLTNYLEANAILSDQWKVLKSKDSLNYSGDSFDKKFKDKMQKLSEQLLINSLDKIEIDDGELDDKYKEVGELFISLMDSYPEIGRGFTNKPQNLKQLFEELNNAKKYVEEYFKYNDIDNAPDYQDNLKKLEMINSTIDNMILLLKGDNLTYYKNKYTEYIRVGSEFVVDYFTK